jgi:ADP-sugar diphosphatase
MLILTHSRLPKRALPLESISGIVQRYRFRTMTTFSLNDSDPACKVTLCEGLSKDEILHHPPFQQWLKALRANLKTQARDDHAFSKAPYALRSIDVQAIDRWGQNRIGFIKFKATVTNDDGAYLPGAVFLRGGSVAMLVSNKQLDTY